MRRIALVALTVTALGALGGVAVAQNTSLVTVVHGVPGLTVDIYVNGELTIEGFAPGDIAGPLELPAGNYDFAITAAGDPIDNAVLEGSASLPSGINATVVAHLDADGNPAVATFVNDTSETDAGEGRLVVRHLAAAPTVDILLEDGTEVFTGVSNPNEGAVDLAAGTYSVVIAPAGAGVDGGVFGPADLAVEEGTVRIVYATGDLEAGTFDLVIQDIQAAAAAAPEAVPAGSGDLAGSGVNPWLVTLSVLAALGLAVSARIAFARNR